MSTCCSSTGVDRWVDEQMFEEDLRAVLSMLRPHRRERLQGWAEYRTGGASFRVTLAWAPEFEQPEQSHRWRAPRLAEVMEAMLVGSARNGDDLSPAEEFEMYRSVIDRLRQRIDELEGCYT